MTQRKKLGSHVARRTRGVHNRMHFTTATRSVSGASNQSLPIAACFHSSVPPNMDLCGGGRGRGEPTRWLEIAGRLLAARDLVGFKRLTECAVEADKHLSGADELLSGANFPRAAPIQWRCSSSSPTPTPSAVLRSFTRLSRLLSSPPRPPRSGLYKKPSLTSPTA
jgi:hypothetical protein